MRNNFHPQADSCGEEEDAGGTAVAAAAGMMVCDEDTDVLGQASNETSPTGC